MCYPHTVKQIPQSLTNKSTYTGHWEAGYIDELESVTTEKVVLCMEMYIVWQASNELVTEIGSE